MIQKCQTKLKKDTNQYKVKSDFPEALGSIDIHTTF